MKNAITLETCIDTPDGLAACIKGGANRVELCAALPLGGLTPSAGLMKFAAGAPLPVHAMIRPVAGDFVLTNAIFETMLAEIKAAKDMGLSGVVIGAMTEDRQLDLTRLQGLVDAAGPLETTLHRAIDLCIDPLAAVDQAAELGITRILTSGAQTTAFDGRHMIGQMVARAGHKLTIMAGAGITDQNAPQIIADTGVRDIHASCSTPQSISKAVTDLGFGTDTQRKTSAAKIKALRAALDQPIALS